MRISTLLHSLGEPLYLQCVLYLVNNRKIHILKSLVAEYVYLNSDTFGISTLEQIVDTNKPYMYIGFLQTLNVSALMSYISQFFGFIFYDLQVT